MFFQDDSCPFSNGDLSFIFVGRGNYWFFCWPLDVEYVVLGFRVSLTQCLFVVAAIPATSSRHFGKKTPPKTNMDTQNSHIWKEIQFWNPSFLVSMLDFGGVIHTKFYESFPVGIFGSQPTLSWSRVDEFLYNSSWQTTRKLQWPH